MACGAAKQRDLNDRIINIESQSENQLLATLFFSSLLRLGRETIEKFDCRAQSKEFWSFLVTIWWENACWQL